MAKLLCEEIGRLVVDRCWCGVQHAVPESLHNLQMQHFNDGKKPIMIYCPLGHQYRPSGVSEVTRVRNRLTAEQARHDQTRAELETTERRRRAEKGAKTRLQKRVAAGVCPCCQRSFQNLSRHMKTKHPEYPGEN